MAKDSEKENDNMLDSFLIIALAYALVGVTVGALAQSFDFPFEGYLLLIFPTIQDIVEIPLAFILKIIIVPLIITYIAAEPRNYHFV
ncbi:MAG: hypothetical protein WC308_02905 [archaeon]|jgi:hypothetical protein